MPTDDDAPATDPTPPPGATSVDVSNEPVYWDVPQAQTYGGYLDLGRLLSAQHPRSPEHDDEQHLVVLGRARMLGAKQARQVEVAGVALLGTDVPVHRLAREVDLHRPFEPGRRRRGRALAARHQPYTQPGTSRQPRTSSRSSTFQSGSCSPTSFQKRGEWFRCRVWQSSWIIR